MKKYVYGTPTETDATVLSLPVESGNPLVFSVQRKDGEFLFRRPLMKTDCVFGLGEQARGINKRGWIYESWNIDRGGITDGRTALYGAHNFLVVDGEKPFGAFFDTGGRITFDVGYTDLDLLEVRCEDATLYIVEGKNALEIVRKFRRLIGQSYIPPKWAFGVGQSRWGYKCEADIREVAAKFEENGMPLDMIYLDIDYMERYKDFTVDGERFPDFPALTAEFKKKGIRFVPIVDAGVKAEKGYSVYEEGVKKGYFCKTEQGEPFVVGVWPGDSVLPDVLNPAARAWFGEQYKVLLDAGIEGFWNDMNEPALFYGKARLQKAVERVVAAAEKDPDSVHGVLTGACGDLGNNDEDYRNMRHDIGGKLVSHAKVHNLYGFNVTRAAAEYFEKYAPDKRLLLFSRSSSIGMHRYGGIWTGDNNSWWNHILLNLKMLPSLNMCGFLFVGADIGGFGDNATEDLMLRWLSLGIFTPLMRNHTCIGTREQEYYLFKNKDAFRRLLGMRYALLPYLYSEFVKCAAGGDMLFKPLCFEYGDDGRTRTVEDQLLVGESLMIAPVYEQNAAGRFVYLPERMKMIRMRAGDDYTETVLEKGAHYIEIPLDEVVFFLREGRVLPLAKPAKNVASLDEETLSFIKFIEKPTEYVLCRDDGFSRSDLKKSLQKLTVLP